MEFQFFSWKGWDKQDLFCFSFYECVLKQAMGDFAEGTEFTCIDVNYETGQMEFFQTENQEYKSVATFDLTLTATLRPVAPTIPTT